VGWREDHRTCYLLSAQGIDKKPHELFSSLHAIEKDKEEEANASVEDDANKLVQSGFLGKLIGESGWDVKVDV